MEAQSEQLLNTKQTSRIKKITRKSTDKNNEVESLTLEVVQLEATLIEEQVKANKREQTFRFIQLLYQEIIAAKQAIDIYKVTVKSLAENIGFDRVVIFAKQNNVFTPIASYGYSFNNLTKRLSDPFFAQLAEDKKGILVNGRTKILYLQDYEFAFQVKYFVAVPFAVHDNVNYILFAGNQTEGTLRRPCLTESDLETLQILGNQISIAIHQIELYTQAHDAAVQATAQAEQLASALRQLQQTQAQLVQTEKMSSLGQLVAGIAHEINNPVTFITGNLSHASKYVQDLLELLHLYQQHHPSPAAPVQERVKAIDLQFLSEDLPKVLSSMQIGANRIYQIVLSLRNFSRKNEAEMKLVNIHEGIDSTLLILQHRLKPQGGNAGIRVVKDYGDVPWVQCYAGQLNQVFMNILSNAIDALEESVASAQSSSTSSTTQLITDNGLWATPTILIRTEIVNTNQVVVRIKDNGPGMTEAVRDRLFDPFFTTKPVGKGTGLGLSISYQIVVEKHGGILKCLSQPGQGAEFWIQIPIPKKG